MDINKIRDAMKVLKEECKKYKACEDCIFYETQTENFHCYLTKEPGSWEEDKILENDYTTAKVDADWRYGLAMECDNCNGAFMLSGCDKEHIVGKFCPHCGKKIINYKED